MGELIEKVEAIYNRSITSRRLIALAIVGALAYVADNGIALNLAIGG